MDDYKRVQKKTMNSLDVRTYSAEHSAPKTKSFIEDGGEGYNNL